MKQLPVLSLVIIFLSACATHQPAEQISPNFFGHYELLTAADRDAILQTAIPRASAILPGSQIETVKVFTGTEVDAAFTKGIDGPTGSLYLQKIEGKWKITIEDKP
jgi:hypothetical protein